MDEQREFVDRPQPFLGAIATGVAVKVAGHLLKIGLEKAVQRAAAKAEIPILPKDAPLVAAEIAVEMAKDPKAVNAMNAEPITRSRVVVGSTMAFVPALGYCIYAVYFYRFDLGRYFADPVLAVAMPAAAGGLYSLYGRLRKGLAPLGWGKKAAAGV